MPDIPPDIQSIQRAIQLGSEQGSQWAEQRRDYVRQQIEGDEASPEEVSWYLGVLSPQVQRQRDERDWVLAREARKRESEADKRLAEQGAPLGTYRPAGETHFVPVPESGIPLGALHVKNPGYK